ncbi:DUF2336 domain-containing protein [Notoacmeibacter ruber]|uniref:DUF2336 domain-containing protein n=1 Tax=Notoacmeibacter ruber TaxID=2670375 RepID=A0A3L7JHL4_9HYPH|nr:DUF2336 domain-containing protein [Notoacmeibacter ruber]RLQ87982.1 DUF2336 domain-containing protein [Notoacmeibacter ruber]
MIVQHFLKWLETAKVDQRAQAANALARAWLKSGLDFDERANAEAALTLLLDDPSPKVRQALADVFCAVRGAPPQIVAALAADQPDVAGNVLLRSPLLSDADLIERVRDGDARTQAIIARRAPLSSVVCATLSELGDRNACLALVKNSAARPAGHSLRRVAERFGQVGAVREALFARSDLPGDVRHLLLVKVGEVLTESPLLQRLMGPMRATRVLREACHRASVELVTKTPKADYPALAEHFRLRGDLTEHFLIRLAAHGRLGFLSAVLRNLIGDEKLRVDAILARGRRNALAALLRKAGLSEPGSNVIINALRLWREVADGRSSLGVQEVCYRIMKSLEAEREGLPTPGNDDILAMIRAMHLDELRRNARSHALSITKAA